MKLASLSVAQGETTSFGLVLHVIIFLIKSENSEQCMLGCVFTFTITFLSITLNLTNNDLFLLFGCGADFFLSVKKYYLILWCLKVPIHKPKNIFK